VQCGIRPRDGVGQEAERQREVHLFPLQQLQEVVRQGAVVRLFSGQAQLGAQLPGPMPVKAHGKPGHHLFHPFHDVDIAGVQNRQQRFGQTGQVPLRHGRLLAVGISPLTVDRAEHRGRIETLHERTRTIVDGLARNAHVVGVHHPVDEAHAHPACNQLRLPLTDGLQHRNGLVGKLGEGGVMPRHGIVEQPPKHHLLLPRREELKSAHPQVAGRHAHQDRPGGRALAVHPLTGPDHRQRTRRGNAQRVHGLAHEVLAQRRAQCRLAIATARKRRTARPLEGQVPTLSCRVDEFPEQQGAAIPQVWRELAELVSRVGLRQRRRLSRHFHAGQPRQTGRRLQRRRLQPQLQRQGVVELHPGRGRGRLGLPRHIEPLHVPEEAVVKRQPKRRARPRRLRLRHGLWCGRTHDFRPP